MSLYGVLQLLIFASVPMTADDARMNIMAADSILVEPAIADMDNEQYQNGLYQTVVVQERVMIRIPARRAPVNGFRAQNRAPMSQPRRVVWQEKKAPRCVPVADLVGVQFVQDDSIDLLTRDRDRVRAALKRNCRAADFYSGFYMKAPKDGMMCAGRDMLQSRSGARCGVERFNKLVPVSRD